jgi:hypothetical protein
MTAVVFDTTLLDMTIALAEVCFCAVYKSCTICYFRSRCKYIPRKSVFLLLRCYNLIYRICHYAKYNLYERIIILPVIFMIVNEV